METQEMNDFIGLLKENIKHIDPFKSIISQKNIGEIVIHSSCKIAEILKEDFLNATALTLKETGYVEYFNKQLSGYPKVKLYDIVISSCAIEQALQIVKEKFKTEIDCDTAIKSIITHEFIHAISVGYVSYPDMDTRNNKSKDESHTDFLANKLFTAIYPERKYFTTYDYPQTDDYEEEMSIITEESIRQYFLGDIAL